MVGLSHIKCGDLNDLGYASIAAHHFLNVRK